VDKLNVLNFTTTNGIKKHPKVCFDTNFIKRTRFDILGNFSRKAHGLILSPLSSLLLLPGGSWISEKVKTDP
jgi:hypothetical protein